MSIENLNQRFGIAGVATFNAGPAGQVQLHIRNEAATSLISLHGAQVLSFIPHSSGIDLLFLSDKATYAEDKAIKGGIPVCWPWFGADPEDRGRPAHGFARTRAWQLKSLEAPASTLTRVVLQLKDDAQSHTLWPYPFVVELTIEIGETLDLALTTYNTGESAFAITQALHTYFSVGAIGNVGVTGLDGLAYLDKVLAFAERRQAGEIQFDSEVDRIYQGVANNLLIHDRARERKVRVAAHNSHTAIVWNPWREVSAAMSDLAATDYQRFVCVETANAANEIISIAPGESYSLGVCYRSAP